MEILFPTDVRLTRWLNIQRRHPEIFIHTFAHNRKETMNFIDTHCHLYTEEFDEDINDVLERAENFGVTKFYLPAIDQSSTERMLNLEARFPDQCIAMIGLHPGSVKQDYKKELDHVEAWLKKRRFVAIGEIGLDYYWDRTYMAEQQDAFSVQMEWAMQHDIPIVIHTRNAMQETIEMVKKFTPKGIRGIFHCFSGSVESAREIIRLGFYLGIGGVITYKNAGVAEVLEEIDLKHIVLETDAPYLTPAPFRGKRNESAYLEHIVNKLALIKNSSPQEIAEITTSNAQNIFGT